MRSTIEPADVIETGRYVVQVVDIEETTSEFNGEVTQQFKWQFEILNQGPYKGRKMMAWSSQLFTAKSKLVKWGAALLHKKVEEMDSLDTDELIGLRAIAIVVEGSKKNGDAISKIDNLIEYVPKDPKKAAEEAKQREGAARAAQAKATAPAAKPSATAVAEPADYPDTPEEEFVDPFEQDV